MNSRGWALVLALVITPAGALATAVAGPGGVAEQGRRSAVAAPAVSAEVQTLELVSAVIDAVAADRSKIVVRGRAVGLHPSRLRVTVGGQPADVGTLRAGQHVRFALEPRPPKSNEPPRIVFIQIAPESL